MKEIEDASIELFKLEENLTEYESLHVGESMPYTIQTKAKPMVILSVLLASSLEHLPKGDHGNVRNSGICRSLLELAIFLTGPDELKRHFLQCHP